MSRHACPRCGVQHDVPKVRAILTTYGRAIGFTAVEVLAALALDGWLSIALWGIAAWNVFLVVVVTIGMAQLAAGTLTDTDKSKVAER